MTTYIIFQNNGFTSPTNELGSEEALACEIAMRVEANRNQNTTYFAINSTGKPELIDFFRNSALCTVEISPENIKIWKEDVAKIFTIEKQMQEIATNYNVEVVKAFAGFTSNIAALMEQTRVLKDAEGYVIGFSILGVSQFSKDKPLVADMISA